LSQSDCVKQTQELQARKQIGKRAIGFRPEKQDAADDRRTEPTHHPPVNVPENLRDRSVAHVDAQQSKIEPENHPNRHRDAQYVNTFDDRKLPCGFPDVGADGGVCEKNTLFIQIRIDRIV
jgi:hypothetical protein